MAKYVSLQLDGLAQVWKKIYIYICVCVCVCVCVSVCMCACVCMYVCMYVLYVCMYKDIYIYNDYTHINKYYILVYNIIIMKKRDLLVII